MFFSRNKFRKKEEKQVGLSSTTPGTSSAATAAMNGEFSFAPSTAAVISAATGLMTSPDCSVIVTSGGKEDARLLKRAPPTSGT